MKTPLDLSKACLYDQLAEEATELAQAAIKMARILRAENPSPVTPEYAEQTVTEEYNDLMNVIHLLGYPEDKDMQREKMRRWIERLNSEQVILV